MAEKRKDNKGRILAKGESQRKDGSYQYRYVDLDHQRKTIYAPSLQELRDKEKCITAALLLGKQVQSNLTGLDLLNQLLALKQQQVANDTLRASTFSNYKRMCRRIKDADVFKKKITDVRVNDAKAFALMLSADGLKAGSVRNMLSLARAAFDIAYENDVIAKNPFVFDTKKILSNDASKVRALEVRDQIGFYNYLLERNKTFYADVFAILIGTGLRISELIGLTVRDIDFKNHWIDVNKQVVLTENGGRYISSPKSDAGNRIIPFDNNVSSALANIIDRRVNPQQVNIDGYSDFVFVVHDKLLAQYMISKFFTYHAAIYNERTGRNIRLTPHVLRHTYCMNLSAAGVHPKVMQYLMGHAHVRITENTYDDVYFDRVQEDLSRAWSTPNSTPFTRRLM